MWTLGQSHSTSHAAAVPFAAEACLRPDGAGKRVSAPNLRIDEAWPDP